MQLLSTETFATQSNKAIESNILIMRQESFSSDLIARFKNTFEGIYNNVTKTLNGIINDSYDVTNRTSKKNADHVSDLEKKIHRLNYVNLADSALPCPDGFKGEWAQYVNVLEQLRPKITLTALNSLEDFSVYLACFISDKQTKTSIKDHGLEYKILAKNREAQNKQIFTFFNSGSNQRQKFSLMFNNRDEIIPSMRESIRCWDTMIQTKPTELKARCEEVATKMEAVITMANKGSSTSVSKEALINLSEGAYEIASQIDFLARFMARTEIAMVTSGNIAERLNSVVK